MTYAFGITSEKSLPSPRSQRFTAEFSSKSFIILDLSFKSMIHFELVFVYGVKLGVQICILLVDIKLSQTICGKDPTSIKLSSLATSMHFQFNNLYCCLDLEFFFTILLFLLTSN